MSDIDETIDEIKNINAQTAKIVAETLKTAAETQKINKQVQWYEVVLISGLAAALLAAGKYLFN